MGRRKAQNVEDIPLRPAMTPDGRENQLIALATSLAEKQLREGTASSQVITHYLKLGTEKYQKELVRLEEENKLLRAKTENLQTMKKVEELYTEAIAAFKSYQPSSGEEV